MVLEWGILVIPRRIAFPRTPGPSPSLIPALGPLGFDWAQHRPTPRSSIEDPQKSSASFHFARTVFKDPAFQCRRLAARVSRMVFKWGVRFNPHAHQGQGVFLLKIRLATIWPTCSSRFLTNNKLTAQSLKTIGRFSSSSGPLGFDFSQYGPTTRPSRRNDFFTLVMAIWRVKHAGPRRSLSLTLSDTGKRVTGKRGKGIGKACLLNSQTRPLHARPVGLKSFRSFRC